MDLLKNLLNSKLYTICRFLHIPSPRSKISTIKINRAISLNDGGLFNFMELNNPGKNHMRLFE